MPLWTNAVKILRP
jgi:hypothetical protein